MTSGSLSPQPFTSGYSSAQPHPGLSLLNLYIRVFLCSTYYIRVSLYSTFYIRVFLCSTYYIRVSLYSTFHIRYSSAQPMTSGSLSTQPFTSGIPLLFTSGSLSTPFTSGYSSAQPMTSGLSLLNLLHPGIPLLNLYIRASLYSTFHIRVFLCSTYYIRVSLYSTFYIRVFLCSTYYIRVSLYSTFYIRVFLYARGSQPIGPKKPCVKSEVSSMTSGHTQGSGPSLSRDSLVVVTHASSGHQKAGEEACEPNSNNNSVRAKTSPRPASNPVAFSPYDLTLPRPPRRDPSVDFEGGVRTLEGVYLPLGPDLHMDDQSASSSALDTVSPLGRTREADASAMDEAFRTRSLPAWVRNKTRPLTTLDDLNTIYEKPHWSKRRRNRMRSDAAAVIALSKSRGRLLSPSPQVTAQTSTSVAAQPDTAALVENEAVIVYDERTAL
ncbi:hypothetical protein C7M84_008731 [Penaeus vannamei]|uniref:Uncharacterized protein n=1 Tax=Penaeus vannamei TaxID=6689 RepID=A0A3R7QPD6_PENVA|nr:hypothetical protein C7M84_008731 [Penaeus vannamei]